MKVTRENSIVITVRIPVEDYEVLKEMREDLDRTTSEIIRRALKSYIKVYQQRKEDSNNGKNK